MTKIYKSRLDWVKSISNKELEKRFKDAKTLEETAKKKISFYEEELERRKQEAPLGVPLESNQYGGVLGTYYLSFASDKAKNIFDGRFNEYVESLQKLAKGEQIDIDVLLPLLPKGWVAMDALGLWCWYYKKPDRDTREWINNSVIPSERLSAFNLKRVEDWKNSLTECGL